MTNKGKTKQIKDRMNDEPGFTIACMLQILKYQTGSEQKAHSTQEQNGVGFTGVDAPFLTALCETYQERGRFSEKQYTCILKCMTKYAGQILNQGVPRAVEVAVESETDKEAHRQKEKDDYRKKVAESSKAQVTLKDVSTMKIVFPYDLNTIAVVKSLSGRRFINDGPFDKYWTAPLCAESVEKLMSKTNIPVSEEIKTWLQRLQARKSKDIKLIDIEGVINGILYPFQHEGVSFIESRGGRALIGDEMGLGKTVQAITWIGLDKARLPAIVVCPASLKLNWQREIKQWLPMQDVVVINGKSTGADMPLFKKAIYIINYDILGSWAPELMKLEPKTLVLDECHYIKNQKAQRTKIVNSMAGKVPYLICLSGTPIINRPIEMFNSIQLIEPSLFPSFFQYAQRYCGATHNGYGWDFKGATNTEELHQKLTDSIMLRRLKSEVLKDLPAKVRTVIPLEINNRRDYDRALKEFASSSKESGLIDKTIEATGGPKASNAGADALVEIEKLKQLCIEGKMTQSIEWIENFLDQGQKLVVFATHKRTIDKLTEHFGKVAVKVDGSVTSENRQAAVDAFQNNDQVRLFVGNIKAAGVGLTLTAASSTCFLELGWTPGEHDQGEDRVHRIGQEADSVNAYYLVGVDTIEEDIAELLDEKRGVLAAVLDGVEVEETSMLTELLNRIENR